MSDHYGSDYMTIVDEDGTEFELEVLSSLEYQGSTYLAVTNIGSRPTVGGHRVTVEPWLLDFSGDIYGKNLILELLYYLRPERKFDSLEQLQTEIRKNAAEARKILEKC